MSKTILVSGATGNQGGAVVDAILASPEAAQYTILGVTRDASSKSAQKLASKSASVKLVEGDFANMSQLFETALNLSSEVSRDGLWGVFSVQVPLGKGQNVKTEERYGKELIDKSIEAGVKHFVYTSVERGGNDRSWSNPTNVPHFISKHNIELHLREKAPATMSYTILRPTAFFDNFTPGTMRPFNASKKKPVPADGPGERADTNRDQSGFQITVFFAAWRDTLGSKPLQLISASDIGYVGAQAFLQPEKYNRKAIGLAGDSVTYDELDAIFREELGYGANATYGILGSALKWAVTDVGRMVDWFASEGYGVDIPELKRQFPGLLDLRQWLQTRSAYEKKN